MIEFQLTSPPDRDLLCASLVLAWVEIAEVRYERGKFLAEIYPGPDGTPTPVSATELAEALLAGTRMLASRLGVPDPTRR